MTWMIFVMSLLSLGHSYSGDLDLKELGEKQFHLIKAKSSVPRHGACWHNALDTVKSSCERLNDEEHSILALRLANCFLEDSGHPAYDCYIIEKEQERRECINKMSDRAFGVYNEFYTHTTHICFFLNHEKWQLQTEDTIRKLYEASSHMKEQLLEASEMQGAMLQSQREGLRMQNELLDHGKELGTVIKSSAETVNDMVMDFKETARDQKELLFQIFSYMRSFQNWVIGEVSWFQSIIYYTVSCILCGLFSASRKTADARVTLFTILSLNVVIERMLVQYHDKNVDLSPDWKVQLIHVTWMFRKGALSLCVATLCYKYYFYRDEQLENSKVLQRIERQLDSLSNVTLTATKKQPVRFSKRVAMRRLQHVEHKDDFEKNLSLHAMIET